MPRQTRNFEGLALLAGADAQQQPESYKNSLDKEASRTTELQQRLNQMAQELRQMQGRRAPKPTAPAVPAVPVKI